MFPVILRDARSDTIHFSHHISKPNHAALNDLGIETTQTKPFPQGRIDKSHRVQSEPLHELLATGVWLLL